MDFEYESKIKIFHSLPCLNDRNDQHEELQGLLSKLGFVRGQKTADGDKKSIFNIFKT